MNMDPQFAELFRDAYENDPCTQSAFRKFEQRQMTVQQTSSELDGDPVMSRLRRRLMAAVFAYKCGRSLPPESCPDQLH